MLAASLLIALVLDRLIPDLRQLRTGGRLHTYISWMLQQAIVKSTLPRLLPYLLVLPILLVVALLGHLLRTSGVFELGFNLLIALLCLKPQVLNEEVDKQITALTSAEPAADTTLDRLFGRANRAIYSVIFWMVVAGPIWVLAYRLLESLISMEQLPGRSHWQNDLDRIVSWTEWFPALISSYLFMLCGNFEAGTRAARDLPFLEKDIGRLNETRLRIIGLAVLQTAVVESESNKAELLKRGRGMLLRTLLVWLLVAGVIDYWL